MRWLAFLLVSSAAWAQDAVEVKTNDGVPAPQVRLSVTSGATTAEIWVRRSRIRFDQINDGYLNIASDAAGTPTVGDLRYDSASTSVLFYDGSAWRTVATTTGSNASVLLQSATPGSQQTGHLNISGTGIFGTSLNVTAGSNQLVLSSGVNQLTLTSGTSAVARTYTVPDVGAGANFVMTEGTQTINGAKTFGNNLVANANTTLGDAATDTVTVTGRFASSLLPTSDATYNLGSTANRWANLYLSGNVLDSGGAVMYVRNQSAAQQASSNYWISGTGRIDTTLTVGGAYSNVYATVLYATGGNIHVQGNEDANGQPIGTRTRLRVGNAWGSPGSIPTRTRTGPISSWFSAPRTESSWSARAARRR